MSDLTITFVDETKQPPGFIPDADKGCGAVSVLTIKEAFNLVTSDKQMNFDEFNQTIKDVLKRNKHCIAVRKKDGKLYLFGVDKFDTFTMEVDEDGTSKPN